MNTSKKSIKARLFFILVLTSSISLLIAGSLFIFFQSLQIKQDIRENLSIQANVIAENAKATIVFEDIEEANTLLSSLHYDTQIISAILLNNKKQILAQYQRHNVTWKPNFSVINEFDSTKELYQETNFYTVYTKSIDSQGNQIGYILLYADFSRYWQLLKNSVLVVFIVITIGFLAALILSYVLQKQISSPIQSFSDFVSHVTRGQNYDLRIENRSYTEIDQLKLAFNNLLSQIGNAISARDIAQEELRQYSVKLQDEVIKRTCELELAKNAAEESSKAKSAFLANISHEIRTPMNSIIGFTKLALENTSNPQQQYQLGYVTESADLLLSLIDDLLDFSKIDANKIDLVWEPCDLYSILDEVSQMMMQKSAEKELELLINICPSVPRTVLVDALRLKQILINLVANAIKFTEKGIVRVDIVSAKPGNLNITIINFSISDTGIGMDAETLSKIFDVFTQADASITRKYGGTGLGLSICKELVSLMGGTLHAQSQLNQGSQFSFSLPLQVAPSITLNDTQPTFSHPLSIMLIEPQQQNKAHLTALLKSIGCHIDSVDNADQGLKLLSQKSFDHVLIRRHLPDIDCFSLVRQIRHNHHSSMMNISILDSILGEQAINAFAKQEYPVSFIKLPIFDPAQLYQHLSSKMISDKSSPSSSLKIEKTSKKLSTILMVDDNEINRILMTEILKGEAEQLLVAENGLQAIKILQQQKVDLVLMDIQMPEMDGYQATQIIRQKLQLTKLQIIGITAFAAEKDKNRCMQAGMNEVMVKPIDIDKFRSLLQTTNKNNQSIQKDADTLLFDIPLPNIDVKTGLSRLHNNADNYKKLLLLFYNKYQHKYLQLEALLTQQQWSSAENLLHDLKGVCTGLAISELAETAILLEDMTKRRDIEESLLQDFKYQFNTLMTQLDTLEKNTQS